jgi:hypothetical protein
MWPTYILLFVQNMAWKLDGIINYSKWLSFAVRLWWGVECASPQDCGVLGFLCNGFVHLYPKKIPMKCIWAQGENFQNIGLETHGWGFRKKGWNLKVRMWRNLIRPNWNSTFL